MANLQWDSPPEIQIDSSKTYIDSSKTYRAIIETNMGVIELELYTITTV